MSEVQQINNQVYHIHSFLNNVLENMDIQQGITGFILKTNDSKWLHIKTNEISYLENQQLNFKKSYNRKDQFAPIAKIGDVKKITYNHLTTKLYQDRSEKESKLNATLINNHHILTTDIDGTRNQWLTEVNNFSIYIYSIF